MNLSKRQKMVAALSAAVFLYVGQAYLTIGAWL